jgi:hypothetical protein
MQDTVRRLAKLLGASSIEASGNNDARFMVQDASGAKLRASIEATSQRFMAVLVDSLGITRCTLDLAPITEAFEEPRYPGRVTLRVGQQLIHIDSQPSLGLEVESIDPKDRAKSQRLRAMAELD